MLLLIYFAWYVSVPRVKVYYSDEAAGKLEFVLNTQHDIFRGEISPGQSTGGPGHLFPDDNFFMQFDWTVSQKSHCVIISPVWPTTRLYIGADGALNSSPNSGTDSDRLKECPL
ncbi:hypothetical protein EKG40_10755 [Pseudomonas moorei]|nr:hypothetical protein EKG40_10755 [Pseudomonas moorei]